MGTGASAFVADAATSITASNNVTTGLTIVSGAHMVDSAEQSRPAATASTAFLLTQKPGSTSVPSGR